MKTAAQVAFLASEAMPALKMPANMTSQQMRIAEAQLASKWIDEINQRSEPVTDQYGMMYDHALLKIVRRALASESVIDIHALRTVLTIAQEAMVRFHNDPTMQEILRRNLRQ